MNEVDQFALLERAEKAMNKSAPITVPQDSMELTVLRSFFDAWDRLHHIKGDKRNPDVRKKYEAAAQELVDISIAVREVRNGT